MDQRHHPGFLRPAAAWLVPPLIGLSLLGSALAEPPPVRRIDATDTPASQEAPIEVDSANDLSIMLPLLITSSEGKRLAADLLDSIKNGDLGKAESSLNAAIETGTLAIALVDRLSDPNLLSSLQSLDVQGERPPSGPSASVFPEHSSPVSMGGSNLAQLQEALDHEQAYSSMITRTLTDLTEQYNALTTRLETDSPDTLLKVSELQNALQQEQQQRDAVAGELARLQADYRALQAAKGLNGTPKSPDISNLESLLQHERARGGDAERRVASVRAEMRSLLASKDSEFNGEKAAAAARITELEGSLSQARARADGLAQKLADATGALDSLRKVSTHKPAPLFSEFVPLETGAFRLLSQENAPDPVEFAQRPEDAFPLSARNAPAAAPAQAEPPPAPQPEAGPPPPAIAPDDRLTARADELLQKGDVSGARLLLERSVKSGSARAAFLLAETFDPHVLAKLRVLGIRGDIDKARQFYAQAQALGLSQASERLQALE